MTNHTRPERAAEFAIARRHLANILKDPCAACIHRQVAFDKSICPTYGRTFPRCTSTPGLQFEPDHDTFRSKP